MNAVEFPPLENLLWRLREERSPGELVGARIEGHPLEPRIRVMFSPSSDLKRCAEWLARVIPNLVSYSSGLDLTTEVQEELVWMETVTETAPDQNGIIRATHTEIERRRPCHDVVVVCRKRSAVPV